MELDTFSVLLEAGSASVVGLVMGIAAKKVMKLVAVLVGVQLMLFKFLESRGVLIVNWDQVTGTAKSSADLTAAAPPAWLDTIVSTLSVGGGFAAGFFLGFKKA